MEKTIHKKMCVMLVALLIVATTFQVLTVKTSLVKVFDGPKEVYMEIKGKPTGTPGNGPPEKPPKDPEAEPDPNIDKWAVVIGISNYRGRQNDLLYCDEDALDMYNYLIDRGYPEGNIKLLLDGNAKAKEIMKAIDWLNSWEKSEDSEVVFFYSGHGSTYDGYDDGDTEYTDEAIVSADLYLILDGQLREKFSDFNSQKISITFDSCFSGGMDDLSTTGRIVVSACGETQLSYEVTSLQHGVFTYYFMEGLNIYHTVEGAFGYAAPLAQNFMQNYGVEMAPQMYDTYDEEWTFS